MREREKRGKIKKKEGREGEKEKEIMVLKNLWAHDVIKFSVYGAGSYDDETDLCLKSINSDVHLWIKEDVKKQFRHKRGGNINIT